jgi:hypothetical protein
MIVIQEAGNNVALELISILSLLNSNVSITFRGDLLIQVTA